MQVDGAVKKGLASTVCLKKSSFPIRTLAARGLRRLTSQLGLVQSLHQKSLPLATSTSPRLIGGQPLLYKAPRSRPPSTVRAGVEGPTQGHDKDLQKKCLQAAVNLQERGWAVVEDVLTQ